MKKLSMLCLLISVLLIGCGDTSSTKEDQTVNTSSKTETMNTEKEENPSTPTKTPAKEKEETSSKEESSGSKNNFGYSDEFIAKLEASGLYLDENGEICQKGPEEKPGDGYVIEYLAEDGSIQKFDNFRDIERMSEEDRKAMKSRVTKIYIPEGTTRAEAHIMLYYWSCPNLETVVFPSTYELLGNEISESSIRYITIPGNIKDINTYSFRDCPNLETIIFEKGALSEATHMSDYTFLGCPSLKDIYFYSDIECLGENVTRLGEDGHLFMQSPDVTLHVLPNSHIEAYAIEHNIPYELIEE